MDFIHSYRHYDVFVKAHEEFTHDLKTVQSELINTYHYDPHFLQQYFSPVFLQINHVKISEQTVSILGKDCRYSDIIAAYRDVIRSKQNEHERETSINNSVWVGIWCVEIMNHEESTIHRILKNIILFHPVQRKIIYHHGFKV